MSLFQPVSRKRHPCSGMRSLPCLADRTARRREAGQPGGCPRRREAAEGSVPPEVQVGELKTIDVGGSARRAIHFHRFRSRGREAQPDVAGALLRIELPEAIEGPLAIGYGSHFGLGLFVPAGTAE